MDNSCAFKGPSFVSMSLSERTIDSGGSDRRCLAHRGYRTARFVDSCLTVRDRPARCLLESLTMEHHWIRRHADNHLYEHKLVSIDTTGLAPNEDATPRLLERISDEQAAGWGLYGPYEDGPDVDFYRPTSS